MWSLSPCSSQQDCLHTLSFTILTGCVQYSVFSSIESTFTSIDTKFLSINAKITDLQLTPENETNHNIRLIAEGHLDLSRKLDDALKVENEKEMLMIQVNTMENEIQKINSRLEDIA